MKKFDDIGQLNSEYIRLYMSLSEFHDDTSAKFFSKLLKVMDKRYKKDLKILLRYEKKAWKGAKLEHNSVYSANYKKIKKNFKPGLFKRLFIFFKRLFSKKQK